jgi:GDP-4-dehydro-6-deoxy-D-mannose reductase
MYRPIDVTDGEAVRALLREIQPAQIFHLAGLNQGEASTIFRSNTLGAAVLLEAVRDVVSDARILLVGSAAEYGVVPSSELPVTEQHSCLPRGAYGISKHAVTLAGLDFVRRLGLRIVVARPFNLIGPGLPATLVVGAAVARLKEALAHPEPPVVRMGNLEARRDFVAVDDVVEAYVRLLEGAFWGEVFNLCTGKAVSIRRVVELILARADRPVRLEADTGLLRPGDVDEMYGSFQKAERAIGFRPRVGVEAAVRAIWDAEMGAGEECASRS